MVIDDGIESSVEQTVSVMDQIFLAVQESVPHVAHVAGDLRRPVAIRIMYDAAEPDFTGADVYEEQQMLPNQSMFRDPLNRGKVGGGGDVLLGHAALLPVSPRPAFQIGNDSVIIRNFPNGSRENIVVEIPHGSGDMELFS